MTQFSISPFLVGAMFGFLVLIAIRTKELNVSERLVSWLFLATLAG